MSDINPIRKRLVYKIDAVLASPALIGSGESESTDSDVLLNSQGNPYLPGCALAGVLRHVLTEEDAIQLFGWVENEKKKENGKTKDNEKMSALWVMDSSFYIAKDEKKIALTQEDIIELDGVALDPENKVALAKKKYDFQAVPKGAKLTLRLMLVLRNDQEALEGITEQLLSRLRQGEISVGAKVGRGFGRVERTTIYRQVFDYQAHGKAALNRWIDFDWDNKAGWEPYTPGQAGAGYATVTAELKLNGSIMIRDTRSLDG
ncbi:MAG: RAMP superfamily CRISPR-associated protein, partial [Desulfovibrionaceae bacterium]|nr:RAMP superfamily CRISPR-associated protein [Desulfovibrionaceae bacterium]